jgi:hypothetical protein
MTFPIPTLEQVSLLPEIVVPDIDLKFHPYPSSLLSQLANTNHQKCDLMLRKKGLTYYPNFTNISQEKYFQSQLVLYNKYFGLQQGNRRFIQRESFRFFDDAGIGKQISALLKVKELTESPCFNYYPPVDARDPMIKLNLTETHGTVQPHHDNLFQTKAIAVVSFGAPMTLLFRHWVTKESFVLLVEPYSLYLMEGQVLREYTHEGNPTAEEEYKGISWERKDRLSLVYGIRPSPQITNSSPLQVFGTSDQRLVVERWWDQTCNNLNMTKAPRSPFYLVDYLFLAERWMHGHSDSHLFQEILRDLKRECCDMDEMSLLQTFCEDSQSR